MDWIRLHQADGVLGRQATPSTGYTMNRSVLRIRDPYPNPKESDTFGWIRIRIQINVRIRIQIRIQALHFNSTAWQIKDLMRISTCFHCYNTFFPTYQVPVQIYISCNFAIEKKLVYTWIRIHIKIFRIRYTGQAYLFFTMAKVASPKSEPLMVSQTGYRYRILGEKRNHKSFFFIGSRFSTMLEAIWSCTYRIFVKC
jgi:hypothetical protein